MKPVLVVDAVGLTPRLLGFATPHLSALARAGVVAPMTTVLPAVTCSAQATMLTGLPPDRHGVVGNGWFSRDTAEIALWRQSNALVEGEKVYETARRLDPTFTCAKIFWWWNLGAAVDWSITPRPFYPADGRKIPAVYAAPTEYGLDLEHTLGPFPFFDFWGPKSGLPSSEWIASAAIRTLEVHRPTLTLVYLPHLDYDFQRHGPDDPRSIAAVAALDRIVGRLRAAAERVGAEMLVVSEYGIEAAPRPVHVNRALREAGLLAARPTPAGEILDVFASQAFAVADHQVAHVYTRGEDARRRAKKVLESLTGVERVLDGVERKVYGLDHPRAGDLVAVAARGAWFTYYYWLEESAEPDFARTVDIHRKPGYDPCELFLDPKIAFPRARIALTLLKKKLGLRYLMRVIPTDATLIKGSHGRLPDDPDHGPVFLASRPWSDVGGAPDSGSVAMTSVPARILELLRRR